MCIRLTECLARTIVERGLTLSESKLRQHRWLMASVFVIYLGVLFYLVFLSNAYGRNNHEILKYQDVNLTPFKTIRRYMNAWDAVNPMVIITNIFGNILAFLPFGFLGPIVLNKMKGFWAMLLFAVMLSGMIELTQGFLGIGVVDVDDVLLNVLGALFGYGLYIILVRPFTKKEVSGHE